MNRQITLEELKEIELSVLIDIHELCLRENFRYSLCAGTLLGAVRHHGFIPWDDDIDIMMPRPDYEKFITFCENNETPFELLCCENNNKYGYTFAKAMKKDTIIIEENANPYNVKMGVYIDIFPFDGLGNTRKEAEKEFKSSLLLRELLVARNWKKYSKSKTHAWFYEPIRIGMFLISRIFSLKKLTSMLNNKIKSIDFEESKFCASILGTLNPKKIIETKLFDEYIDMEFEGKLFKSIKNYDEFLNRLYGNYMVLPPEEKRISHHTFKAWYQERK